MKGRVISVKTSKTATVLIERLAMHPLYKKTFLRSKNILVDDAIGVQMGDIVEMVKVKPISKNKHWSIVKIVGKNLTEIVESEQKEAAEKVISEVMPEEKTEEPSDVSLQTEKVNEKEEKPKKSNKRKEKSDS